jgi:hypothetical protein
MGRLQCWLEVFLSYRLGEQHTAGGAVAAMNPPDPTRVGQASLRSDAARVPARSDGPEPVPLEKSSQHVRPHIGTR